MWHEEFSEGDRMLRRVLVPGWDKFSPPAKQSRKLYSTGERVVVAIFDDVGLGAHVLMSFWRVEAARSVESPDRASFYEFFLLIGTFLVFIALFD
ncbi:hypothetical protein Taro_027178 [Colocasia esculenta]|uniref:Uncharacterized protein n=1 Tax=Colocasia esculenta TaxID=4460 RepID=A0A843VHD3_COLES|nr:hypothetical protein [Colocasia esculenta]